MNRPLRVLLGKPGLDGHNRGLRVIAQGLRDAGMEVIYTGIRRTPSEIARAAIAEDVDAVGVSNLTGAHLPLFPRVAEKIRAAGGDDIVLFCGGIIPEGDRGALTEAGYEGIFTPGTSLDEIAAFLLAAVARHRP